MNIGKLGYRFIITFLTPALIADTNEFYQKAKTMKRAKFSFKIETLESRQVLTITDLYTPADFCRTVTNDIENVLDSIERGANIHAERFVIVYRDCRGIWDGYNARTQKFMILNCPSWDTAAAKYIHEKYQPQHA